MNRRDLIKSLGMVMAATLVPINFVKAEEYTGLTYVLKTQFTPELIQDLNAYNNLDARKELEAILELCLEKEIGTKRGTISDYRVLDENNFQVVYKLKFKHDGQFGKEELWGVRDILNRYIV